jgi:hypothetical protein
VAAFVCVWCGADAMGIRSTARYCTRSCKWKAKEMRRRARKNNASGEFSQIDLERLWLRFQRRCAYCSSLIARTQIQADHVHPISRGGRNDVSNLLPACHECNADKRDLFLHEWAADRLRRRLSTLNVVVLHGLEYEHLVLDQSMSLVGAPAGLLAEERDAR